MLGILNLNNKGEAGSEPPVTPPANESEKLLSQTDVDRIVQERLGRERAKFSDYDELAKFKTEHQKNMEAQTQKELEAKNEYDKVKEGWSAKENEYKTILSQKDAAISSMKVSNSLTSEILKQNAYPEAAELVKANAVIDNDGVVRIKGKDSNGIETQLTVEDGVKQFLEQRPYLVKAATRAGAGTGPATGSDNPGGGEPRYIQLQNARASNDRAKVKELKAQIKANNSASGTVVLS